MFVDSEDRWKGRDTKVAGDVEKQKPEIGKQSLAKENCRQIPDGVLKRLKNDYVSDGLYRFRMAFVAVRA